MSAPDANGWYDMETAPKDGTEILAALRVHNTRGKWWWERHVIRFDPDCGDIDLNLEQGWSWEDYTHWQHLPPPPVDGASQ